MHTAGRATLAVLGAGPKGIAIAAKHAALARTGWEVPDLLLIDGEGVAANWSGAVGYTDGRQRLSTAPEKDVGFPYAHTWGADSERISHEMSRWSWQSYLVTMTASRTGSTAAGPAPPTASGASTFAGSPHGFRSSRCGPRSTASTSLAAVGA
jgi:mycobactin lysine-N-oxygenase